jgi:hypothetical protein
MKNKLFLFIVLLVFVAVSSCKPTRTHCPAYSNKGGYTGSLGNRSHGNFVSIAYKTGATDLSSDIISQK